MALVQNTQILSSDREYFIDDFVRSVPEFLTFSGENVEHYRELTTFTLADVARWLKVLVAQIPRNGELIERICSAINAAAVVEYSKDEVANNICVSFFWGLDYDTIATIRPYLSDVVAELGNRYLAITGPGRNRHLSGCEDRGAGTEIVVVDADGAT